MEERNTKILVSACLAGEPCRYDGKANTDSLIREWVRAGYAIPVCPERDGGMPTPRLPSEIQVAEGCRKVYNKAGEDVTAFFVKGAEVALETARNNNCLRAVLKAKSPSCGCGRIYDGSFSGKLIEGNGMTAELLQKNGIQVKTEISRDLEDWAEGREETR